MRLLLIAACLLLAAPGWSVPVDPDNPDGIAAILGGPGLPAILRTDGIVQSLFNRYYLFHRHVTEVCSFWEVASDQTDAVFDRSLLPTVIWLAEV